MAIARNRAHGYGRSPSLDLHGLLLPQVSSRRGGVWRRPLLHPSSNGWQSHQTQSKIAPKDLTKRWSQPLTVVKSTFNFMKQFQEFATLAPASGGSAPSR